MTFLENKAFQYGLFCLGSLIVFDICWYFKKKKCNNLKDTYEVFWTNNLSQSCSCSMRKKPESCQNNYCYVRTLNRIISLIDQAKHSIDLAMYIFTSHELTNSIRRARERGIRVRIIVDKNMVYSTGSKIIEFDANDIPVRYHPTSTYLMHHKFCVFDGPGRVKTVNKKPSTQEQKSFLLTGSTNWTNDGFSTNWENILITTNKQLITEFENEFQRIWSDFERNV